MIKRFLKSVASTPQPDAELATPKKLASGPATRVVEGVTVRTYRGASLAELAPQIRAELGDAAMILRQREGLTGGIAGFFAKACVEVDVAVLDVPGAPVAATAGGRIDTVDGPAAGPPAFAAPLLAAEDDDAEPASPAPAGAFEPLSAPSASTGAGDDAAEPSDVNADAGTDDDEDAAPAAPAAAAAPPIQLPPLPGAFSVRPPSAEQAAAIQAALPQRSFEEHLHHAGLSDAPPEAHADAPAEVSALRRSIVRRGLPDQVIGPVADDTLTHRVPLAPGSDPAALLTAELARRIPTAPLAGAPGQAIAFVGTGGAGKTRAIARLAAAYAAAGSVPVACVTLQGSGDDHLLAQALAPFGVPVHAAPDTPSALDRVTALRRDSLVLIDTPAASAGDEDALRALGGALELLELDAVALCLPVTLAAAIARRMLRTMQPLRPTMLVATHADEADLLGGVVAVAIDRRVPIAYISSGSGPGQIAAADPYALAASIVTPGAAAPAPPRADAAAAAAADAAPAPAAEPATTRPQPWGYEGGR